MINIQLEKPLTNVQLEMLKIFGRDLPEDQLFALKELISDFMLDLARDEADKAWEKRGYNASTVNKWLHKSCK